MTNLILLEHFTSQSNIDCKQDKIILREAMNIANTIIENFINHPKLNKLFVLRNYKLRTIKSEKVIYCPINKKNSYEKVLNKFVKNDNIILIAPEINKESINYYYKLKDKFKLLGSNFNTIKVFSSKIKTLEVLKKKKIPVIQFSKSNKILSNTIVVKPEYGAGSSQVLFARNEFQKKTKKSLIFQKFYEGIKGSFLMLCSKGLTKVLCCNEQIVKINKRKISQTGCIIGGLEPHRKEIEFLAENICRNFRGFSGIIGVDIVRYKNKWLVLEINPRFTSSYCALTKSYSYETVQDVSSFYLTKHFSDFVPEFIKPYIYNF